MPIGGNISNFPQGFTSGLAVRGMPLIQMQPGNVFWLDNSVVPMTPQSKGGSDSSRGTYQQPFSTLAGALLQCMPGRGDIIFVGSGHAESIGTATALNVRVSGVAIIGLGAGDQRPTFTLGTANTAVINISGDNISFQNCRFVANFLNIAQLFNLTHASMTGVVVGGVLQITAATTGTLYVGNSVRGTGIPAGCYITAQLSGTTGGVGYYQLNSVFSAASTTVTTTQRYFSVDNCDISDTSASLNFLNLFTTGALANACDGLQITRNVMTSTAASGAANLLAIGAAADRVAITDNVYTALTTGTGAVIVCSTFNLTNFLLLRNTFVLTNAAATATGYLITGSGTGMSGMIDNNTDFCLANTTYSSSLAVTAGTGLRFGINRHARTADRSSGATLPTPDA